MSLTTISIPAARAIIAAATPGPWAMHVFTTRACTFYRVTHKADGMNHGAEFTVAEVEGTEQNNRANATFIANARALLPAALDRIEALEASLATARDELARALALAAERYQECEELHAAMGEPSQQIVTPIQRLRAERDELRESPGHDRFEWCPAIRSDALCALCEALYLAHYIVATKES